VSTEVTGTLVWYYAICPRPVCSADTTCGDWLTINHERDSVRFYVLRTTKYLDIEKLGVPSRPGDAEAFL
jgi:hypothetical protein